MDRPDIGDRVRIDIPDETDHDHENFHGKHGRVVDVTPDDADAVTGRDIDSGIYRVELDDGTTFDARLPDLRPPIDE